jgi:hypothetical protein
MRGQGGGPRTAKGKAVVGRNAVKHGLRSEIAVIDQIEDPDEWESFRAGIVESLQPEGVLETDLAEHIALTRWKLRRVAFFQALKTRYYIDKTEENLQVAAAYAARTISKGEYPEIEERVVRAYEMLRVLPSGDDLKTIIRYEAHLHRLWVSTLHELEALQSRRRGERSPLARFDISTAPQ